MVKLKMKTIKNESDLYKKCGYRKIDNFEELTTWS